MCALPDTEKGLFMSRMVIIETSNDYYLSVIGLYVPSDCSDVLYQE